MLHAYLEAQYSDGYIVREDADDRSAFVEGKNTFHDILNGLHETAHGPLLTLSLVVAPWCYTIDWTVLPVNARPIRFKNMQALLTGRTWGPPECLDINFGYQFTDGDGANVQDVINVPLR